MSARQEHTTHSTVMLARVREFLRDDPKMSAPMARDERAKVRALCGDLRRLDGSTWMPVAPGFGRIFSGFERLASVLVQRRPRSPDLPALDDAAMKRAAPREFAADYAAFDRLSILYGGLFRGSVIVNYLLGIIVVGLTVASILPQPKFIASGAHLFPEFAHYALRIELLCIAIIAAIFYYGQTPDEKAATDPVPVRRRGLRRRIAHRWHERWLEYRVLAERFRYLELMLSISPGAAQQPPFAAAEGNSARWYDHYFSWRTSSAKPIDMKVTEYREGALALMVEQIDHHSANSLRRGAIATRLHRFAVILFFSSIVFCCMDLIAESSALSCVAHGGTPVAPCVWSAFFDDNLKSLVVFGAVLAPVLAAAIHGVLATTEYTKVAQSSREIAQRITSLVATILAFQPSEHCADQGTLAPIRDAVTAFADAAINEASGWRAMLRDKNIPLA